MRIDKWLWHVRLAKTRSLASKACLAGHVRIDGAKVKPSRDVAPGMKIVAERGGVQRVVVVKAMPLARVGAKLVADFYEDMTPPPEPENNDTPKREHGAGRPTKRDRREIKRLLSPDE